MLFHPVEMSNNCKKKGRKGKKNYLTSDLSSGINKRLSPNVKKKRGKSNLLFAILFALLNPLTVFVFQISS